MIFNAPTVAAINLPDRSVALLSRLGLPLDPERWIVRGDLDGAAAQWYNARPKEQRDAMWEALPDGGYLFAFDEREPGKADLIFLVHVRDDAAVAYGLYGRGFYWLDRGADDQWLREAAFGNVVSVYWFARERVAFSERIAAHLRRSREAGLPNRVGEISVVRLRRAADPPRGDGEPVDWSHRWIVRAHARRLADGRLVPVRAHVKGPSDKPLVLSRVIQELAR